MKITFLGTGTSTGIPTIGVDRPVCKSEDSKDIRLRSSILINVKQKNILIDCSPDFRQQMLNNNFYKIDAILFTHEHSDHTAGLDDVRPISFKYGKIPLFGKKEFLKNWKKDLITYLITRVVIQDLLTFIQIRLRKIQTLKSMI